MTDFESVGVHVFIQEEVWLENNHGSPRHAPYLLHISARGIHVGRYPPQPVSLTLLPIGSGYFLFIFLFFSLINIPTFSTPISFHIYAPMKMEQSVSKRRHIKFRRQVFT
jgi:hypothetical protein